MTNQALLDIVAYKTYYAIASGAEPPKSKKSQKKSDLTISSEESPSKKKSAKAKKFTATKPKPTKKKAPVKADRGKGLNVFSEVALLKLLNSRRLPNESRKISIFLMQVAEVMELILNPDDEGNDATDGNDDDDNHEDDDTNDGDEETDSDRTESDIIKIHVLNQSSTDYYEEEEEKIDDEEKMDEEEDDEVTKELYNDVNVNLGNKDADMTDVDQGGAYQKNVSQESGFEQVEEDAHVTLTPVLDIQKKDEPVQSSSVSSDFRSKLLNLENPSLDDNEIASLMDTIVHYEEQGNFSSVFKFNNRVTNLEKDLSEIKQDDQYAQALSFIPAIVDHYREEAQAEKRDYIKLVDSSMRVILKEEVNTQLPQILPQAVSDFAIPVIEKNVTESLEAVVFARELYDALVKSYQTDKDLFDTYGEVFTLKRSRDDKDKDQDPSAGSDRGTKRRKLSKEVESSRDSRSKEKKSSSTSKDASHSQHKPSGKSAHAEEPSHTVNYSGVQQNQEFDMGNNDEQPTDKEVSKADWFKKPERPATPDLDWNKR
ncbi:hypothetical protein Tco_0803576 [Tanacetum coccineum]|uniref:Uncharacterized protein n=1 Tax=Tanacetum coccineum TaxID=301880 RepID=A0ABQ5A6C7_9ASTR